MGGNIVVDDNNSNVAYSGNWQLVQGSTRQWDGAVHTTFQRGASAVIRFRANTVTVIGTVPSGNGQQAFVDIKLDDMPTVRVTKTSGSADVYDETFWTSPPLLDITHTLTLTNQGGGDDLNFSFDRLKLDANSFNPVLFPPQAAPPPQPPSPTPPRPDTTPDPTTNPQSGQQTSANQSASGDPTSTPGSSNGVSQSPTSRDPSQTGTSLGTSVSSNVSSSQTSLSGTVTPDPQQTVTQTQTQLQRFTLSDGSPDPNITGGVSINAGGGGAQGVSPPLAAILGGVLGGLLVIGLIVLACLIRKRRRKVAHARLADTADEMQEGSRSGGTRGNRSALTPRPFVDAEMAERESGNTGVPVIASAEKAAMREQMEVMASTSPITPSSAPSSHSRATGGHTESISPSSSIQDKRHDTCFCHAHGPNTPAGRSAHTQATLQLHDKPEPLSKNDDDFYAKPEGDSATHSPGCPHSQTDQMQEINPADPPRLNLLDMPPSYLPITRRYSTAV
ncbi:hypothetical protein BJ165DRAFT_1520419 [Panaeolus papilionaceus]|nr:hypothetical protein BJ165DRAFT_1520419 [Panaeolus papilionaceus]